MTKRYYDRKMKEFFELKLGSMPIDEYEQRFLELLKYVPFIKDETVKIQRYLSGPPSSISDKIVGQLRGGGVNQLLPCLNNYGSFKIFVETLNDDHNNAGK